MSKNQPKVNYLAALFRAYRKTTGLNSTMIGAKVGCTADNARRNMNKPGENWTIGSLLCYCDVLGIPRTEAFDMAQKDYDSHRKRK